MDLPRHHGSTRTIRALSPWQYGVRALGLGAFVVLFVTAMLSPAMDGMVRLPDHVLGKLEGEPQVEAPARVAPPVLTTAQRGAMRRTAIRVAALEVGVKEWNSDNKGARIVTFRRAVTGVGENPRSAEPWCADFVSWAWRRAGNPIGFGGRGSDYVPELVAWGKVHRSWRAARTGYRPVPGDLVVYSVPGVGRYGHIGMVVGVGKGQIRTVEGNYQDKVSRRKLSPRNAEVQGFIRPV